MLRENQFFWNNGRISAKVQYSFIDDLPSPNPEQVETFKEEAEEEVQLKLDI